MCEEASVLNAGLYLENKKLTRDQFEAELRNLQKIEQKEMANGKAQPLLRPKNGPMLILEEA